MQESNPLITTLNEPFVASTEHPALLKNRLIKLEGGAILFCLSGWAQLTIDLNQYEMVRNTQIVLLPGAVICFDGASDDFNLFIFSFHGNMLREACLRLDTNFFHFLKEKPSYTLPEEFTYAIRGLMAATTTIYNDRNNRFRYQIAQNHLQSFMMDIYDKCCRFFTRQEIERTGNRQKQLFERFIDCVHNHAATEREVNYYADKLCISTKYLTGICRSVTGKSAKMIIDNLAMLEIKVLLQSTGLLLQEIADQMNFPDQSYLGRYFKRYEGISPADYRKIYKNGTLNL